MINFYEKIKEFQEDGKQIHNLVDYQDWTNKVEAYLIGCGEKESFDAFRRFRSFDDFYNSGLNQQLEVIHGLLTSPEKSISQTPARINSNSKDVFIVHGHDKSIKEATARFIQNLNLNPIILHEKPNSGNTIIEKFEINANVGYAIILLTYDDEGKAKKDSSLQPRARQNVIFELGYFFGRIGRSRVCVLFEKRVEIPSDYKGILYIELDEAEGWKRKLAQELVNANMNVDLKGILG